MAAPTENASDTKDKPKPYHYVSDIQPDDKVLDLYIDTMSSCGDYKSDYKACKSTRGRVYQYFLYGKELDCEHFNTIYKTCEKFLKTQENKYRDYMVQYERAKRDFRVQNSVANDVWEYRTTPYKEWNSPLHRVDLSEVKKDDDSTPEKQNADQITASSVHNVNKSNNSSEKLETVVNQSSEKEGNSNQNSDQKGDKSTLSEKPTATCESNNNKSLCVVS